MSAAVIRTVIRTVIADDEPVARRGLGHLLLDHDDVAIVGEARNGGETVRAVATLAPDLLLLDVEMPGGDGFEILRRLDPPRPYVIFVTAHEDYAVRAFETDAVDYLLKPVHAERFHAALERARGRIRSAAALQSALHPADVAASTRVPSVHPNGPARRLVVPGPDGAIVLDIAEVTWIEAEGYYAAVHVVGRRHLVRESLDSLARRLDPRRFVRVHRSAIVNLAGVRAYRRSDGASTLTLRDGTAVPVSRRRRALVAIAIRRFGSNRQG